jgi:hypothetical protein
MAVTVAQVRQRVAAALEAAANWSESNVIGGSQWQNTGEGESAQSGTFAVTVPLTAGFDTADGLLVPGRSAALTARTEVRIDWRYRVRSDAQVADYDAALTQEQVLRVAARSADATGGLRIFESVNTPTNRQVVQDDQGLVIAVRGVLSLIAIHPFARS